MGSAPFNRVGIFYAAEGGATRFRCFHVQEQLHQHGIASNIHPIGSEGTDINQFRYDILLFHRTPYNKVVESIYRHARANNALIIFDTDDLVFDRLAYKDVSEQIYKKCLIQEDSIEREIEGFRRAMYLSDAIVVSTKYLSQEAISLGKPTWVHRNGFSLEMQRLSEYALRQRKNDRWDNKIIIGYASGTPSHDRDFLQAKEALKIILRRFSNVELWIVGYLDPGEDWESLTERVRIMPFIPWQELPSLLVQFDINIAPLEIENPFCHGKSEVKYIEAGLVMVPTVASRTEAYEYAIKSGENGILVKTHEEWIESLAHLIEDEEFRRVMGYKANIDVVQRYHPLVRGSELITVLNRIWNQEK